MTAGNADASTYDANNRIVSYTDRLGNEAVFTYHDPSGFPASVTDFSGATWTMDYQQQAQDGFRFYVPRQLTFPDAAIRAVRVRRPRQHDEASPIAPVTSRPSRTTERGQLLTR